MVLVHLKIAKHTTKTLQRAKNKKTDAKHAYHFFNATIASSEPPAVRVIITGLVKSRKKYRSKSGNKYNRVPPNVVRLKIFV